jgi:DNA-binding CsgD family transcriptional regulator
MNERLESVIELRADLIAAQAEIARLREALTSIRALEALMAPPQPRIIDLDRDLTRKENETLGYLMTGASNQEIGRRMFLTPSTVRTHVAHIFNKLGVHSRSQAAVAGLQLGLRTEAP